MSRTTRVGQTVLMFVAALAMASCEHIKSANPLAPTVAGPMAGIEIVAPKHLEPWTGKPVLDTDQPLVIILENARSNSPRPFTMAFEIASDNQFSSIVFSMNGIKPGDNGQTRLTLPQKLPSGRTYYWHMKADDGANTSGWSPATYFQILQPIVIGVPRPVSPAANERVATLTPEFRADNGASSGPHGNLAYNFQISESQTFGTLFTNAWVDQNPAGQTRYTMPALPAADRTFFWRVRISDGPNTGDWSKVESFRSPLSVGGGGGGGGGTPGAGGPPSACASSSGPAVVACIEKRFPQYLAAGVSHNTRVANMEFLRDRVIESARCGGMDVSWNLKRGVGPLSSDAIAWRTGGATEVVDIGSAFDDTSVPLRLAWSIVTGPPGYTPYPAYSCN